MTQQPANINLYCLMQNRLGAMDRILGALTHRGIIPARMVSAVREDGALEMLFSFAHEDDKNLEKLVKFLQKQIYVLAAHADTVKTPATEASNITPLFVSDVISPHYHTVLNETAQRRVAHAHNA